MIDRNNKETTNRLINEKSPYLLQHAHNPVDWYPWGNEAFEKARTEDKRIFLSIGYSTCHWCHIMEQESFEDNQVANLLNEGFISIKVDREERPDIDNIYMNICQMMTGSGGWPLTIVMTPEKKPFFSATYIPKDNKYGIMGMTKLLPRISELWQNDRKRLVEASEDIIRGASEYENRDISDKLDKEVLDHGFNWLRNAYDKTYGGFNREPKFPMPHYLIFLLRHFERTREEEAITMVKDTLKKMREGGIYDQLGNGFHRYSTDRKWLVPHFEKMLYDQALLAYTYIEAYQATEDEFFKRTASEIFDYVLWSLTSAEGGFYSAEDADSEGIEGKFYTWGYEELKEILDENEFELAVKHFKISKEGNFELEKLEEGNKVNILTYAHNINEDMLQSIKTKLLEVRAKRIMPYKDTKILTDWNGLMIAALAKGYTATKDGRLLAAAEKAAWFILDEKEELLHRYREGEWKIKGMIDDYSFMIFGLMELYEASLETKYLKKAVDLAEVAKNKFWDEGKGGFYLSEENDELPYRNKDYYDNAIPSGNSVMILNLIRLYRITGNNEYDLISQKLVDSISGQVAITPAAFMFFLVGIDYLYSKTQEVILVGNKENQKLQQMKSEIDKVFMPNRVVVLKQEGDAEIERLAEYLKDYGKSGGEAAAYVCSDFSCSRPVYEIGDLMNLL